MKIGIIAYSHGGHTLKAARRLQEKLAASGHQVELERLEVVGLLKPNSDHFSLKAEPALSGYDAVVFCSPVYGGVPAKPLLRYLDHIPDMKGRQAAGLVTNFFPSQWGADQALAAIQGICESKGADYRGSGNVRWFGFGRGKRMKQAAEAILGVMQ